MSTANTAKSSPSAANLAALAAAASTMLTGPADARHATSRRPADGGPDVRREVLAGQRRAAGDEVGRRALEDDAAAVVAGARAEVDDPVGVRHHGLVVLDHDDRLAGVDEPVEQAEQLLDVGEVEAAGRLVEDVDAALLAQVGGELEPLPLAARERGERLAEREVAEPDVGEPVQDLVRGRDASRRRRRRTPRPRPPASRAPRLMSLPPSV